MPFIGLRGVFEVGTINNWRVLGASLASCMTFDVGFGKGKGGRRGRKNGLSEFMALVKSGAGTNCSVVFYWGVVCCQRFYGTNRAVDGLYSAVTRLSGVRLAWQRSTSGIFDLVWDCDAPGGFMWSCDRRANGGTLRVLVCRL